MSPLQTRIGAVLLLILASGWFALPRAAAVQSRAPRLVCTINKKAINECSGLAVSGRDSNVLWLNNDSGDDAELFAVSRKGEVLAALKVTGASAKDWEDIALTGSGDSSALWIGDFGNNSHSRRDLCLYRIDEPALPPGTDNKLRSMLVRKFPFEYPDGNHDCETLLVDPTTETPYVLTKASNGKSGLYKFPIPLTHQRMARLEKVGDLTFNNPIAIRGVNAGKLATGGAVSANGAKIVVRTYAEAFLWTRKAGQTLEQAMRSVPRPLIVPFLGQYEAITFGTSDGRSILTAPEGSPCPIWEVVP